jgi:P-type Cu2+ transporter
LLLASRPLGNGLRQVDLSVPDVHCGACIATIEKCAQEAGRHGKRPGQPVDQARLGQLARRRAAAADHDAVGLGYAAHLFDPGAGDKDEQLSELIRALGVAGFAAANIMLLSVSVWSGADARRATSCTSSRR